MVADNDNTDKINQIMNIQALTERIEVIIRKTLQLKEAYMPETLGVIDYVMMFPSDDADKLSLVHAIELIGGKVVFSDDNGTVYQFENSIKTFFCDIDLLKIGNNNDDEKRIGYVDFRPIDYTKLKLEYINCDNVVFVNGNGWELIGVEDPLYDVSFYVPNVPLSEDLNLN